MATADGTDIHALGILTRHPVCPPRVLAEKTDIPERTLHNAIEGLTGMGVPNLRLVLRAMVELGQERDALDLVTDLLGLPSLGWELRISQRPAGSECLMRASLRVGQEAGEVLARVNAALEDDGRISPSEAEAIRHETADLRYAADVVAATASAARGDL